MFYTQIVILVFLFIYLFIYLTVFTISCDIVKFFFNIIELFKEVIVSSDILSIATSSFLLEK